MRQLIIIFCLISGLMAIDIYEVVKKGLEKKSEYMDTDSKLDSKYISEIKAQIRLLYIKMLQTRDKNYIVEKALAKAKELDDKKSINFFENEKLKYDEELEEYKKSIESLIEEKVDNINEFKPISFDNLKSIPLDELVRESYVNSDEIVALENYFNKHDEKKSDNSWKPSISYDVMYGFETGRNSRGDRGSRNEIEVGISIDFTKGGGSKNDSSIEVAKKRRDLELKKSRLKNDIKSARDMYVDALRMYKKKEEEIKNINTNDLKSTDELKKAYEKYMIYIDTLYDVYKRYIALMQIVA